MNTAASIGLAASPHEHAAHADVWVEREFGFWLYLMSDAIVFALLFAVYVTLQSNSADGPTGKSLFSLSRTFAETLLLLASSFSFTLVSDAARGGRRRAALSWMALTLALGLAFFALEMQEFTALVRQGAGPSRSGFLSAFFTLVGAHGAHVALGSLWLVVLAVQVARKGLSAPVQSRLARLGLFWHFLDLVWIGIFSVVYLPGML